MKYRLAIFDMDGTILDTLEDLCNSVNHTLEQFSYPTRTLMEVRAFVGNGAYKLMERALPSGSSQEDVQQAYEAFRIYYDQHCAINTKPYAGIIELINNLRDAGVLCAVVSNKPDSAVQPLCLQYFPGMFDAAVGEKEGVRKKPAPDSVNAVLAELGSSAADAIYIGDSEVDIQTAVNSGLPCISVSWGFKDVDFLQEHGATRIVDEPAEILDIILGD